MRITTAELLAALALAGCARDLPPVDPDFQRSLEEIDARIGAELGIPADKRACGVFDLTDSRLAMVNPDVMFYGASVPKVCILAAYFEKHPGVPAPAVRRELELMIKRSDNDKAAKYSQIVGLETIQAFQRAHGLYDPARGGGLWSGKHYGIDQPRIGDPLQDLSHAATVRQCLRFYWLMDRGKLAGSAEMRRIFEAPDIAFHDDNFVRGLAGRPVTIIRKNGLWEDWHLDTARITHGERTYLLAGIAWHPKGQEYLARLAAAVDGPPPARPVMRHVTVVEAGPSELTSGYEPPPIDAPIPFNEALLSWNVDDRSRSGFVVELRVGREEAWSPWLTVGISGNGPPVELRTDFDGGKIDVDYFVGKGHFTRAQWRIWASAPLRVASTAICFTDTTGMPLSRAAPPAHRPKLRLPVPFRSQKSERADLAPNICSPTSVAMLMEYRGVKLPTDRVAAEIYDPVHEIYGNWPRAVQVAFQHGLPGYLTRFSDWAHVERSIGEDMPLIISIRAAEGELRGAPYRKTDGHLLVLCGFDADGNAEVNDPAGSGAATYRREDLEKVWFSRGGTAYVILAPGDRRSDDRRP